MPRTNKNFTEKVTVQITPHMKADLDNIAAKSGEPLAEIIRQAIRNALDDTDLTLGTRRRFDRRFQKRFDEMEAHLEQTLTDFLQSTRDVFIQDVVTANILAATRPAAVGEIFNIATGIATTINKITEIIREISDRESQIIYADPRAGEVRHSRATIEKAQKLLGYSPTVDLNKGLLLTWQSVMK